MTTAPLQMQWEVARHLTAAGGLCCTHETATLAVGGLANGGWGIALALRAFLGNHGYSRLGERRITAAADQYAAQQINGLAGLGLFTGNEGQALLSGGEGQRIDHDSIDEVNWREEPPGDLMNGPPGVAWARFCLGQPNLKLPAHGVRATNPGLAHGELVRYALPGQFTREEQASTLSGEVEALGSAPGWCNGLAGAVVALATQDLLEGNPVAVSCLAEVVTELRSCNLDDVDDVGLCHGLLGIAIVMAGVGRIYAWVDCTDAATRVTQHAVERLNAGGTGFWETDLTWLTGAAGILWALQVIEQQPFANPLFPLDSQSAPAGRNTARRRS